MRAHPFILKIKSNARALRYALLAAIAAGSIFAGGNAHAFCVDNNFHTNGRTNINNHTSNQFNNHRNWMTGTFATQHVIPALKLFTEQMTAVAMQQTMIIGTFFDAKHQLETQRLFQEMQVEAHKDYQPSESFCAFGTNVRSLAHSESMSKFNALTMARRQQARHLGLKNMAGASNETEDKIARWKQYTEHYCDPQDNNWVSNIPQTGLTQIVDKGNMNGPLCAAPNSDRVNIDIDFTRMVENRRTIDVAFPAFVGSPDELDIMSLGNNLYGHEVMFRNINRSTLDDRGKANLYMDLRSVAAKRSVAENSFNAIVGMKMLGSGGAIGNLLSPSGADPDTYRYLGAVLTNLGIPEAEAKKYLGLGEGTIDYNTSNVDPSYFAQLEILAKKIYQSPDFYANLYDKPANIKRKSAALKAIELMVDRAIYESQLRQEMAMSVLLSSRLRLRFKDVDKSLNTSSE